MLLDEEIFLLLSFLDIEKTFLLCLNGGGFRILSLLLVLLIV